MSFSLSDGTTTVTLYPKWDYKYDRKMQRSDHRMYDASLFSYKWATWDKVSIPLDGVSPADAATINGWWENATNLTLDATINNTAHSLPVIISGTSTPFPKFLSPRVDYYKGKLDLEGRYPAGLFLYLLADHEGDYIIPSSGDFIGVLSR